MEKTLKEAFCHRRSYYRLSAKSPLTDGELEQLVRFTVEHTPSAFNSQSARLVLLLHDHHARLWQLVHDTLQAIVPAESFAATEEKICLSFASGYGTVLFFEDESVVSDFQHRFPLYADRFPLWSEHTSAMHQLTLWTLLEEAGLGASLQHYNPLIDSAVHTAWGIPASWRLIAQMPFGVPLDKPAEKSVESLDARVRVLR